jgi:diguanylate cyclase (GGDEF)-like protein
VTLEPALRLLLDPTGQLTQDQVEALPDASFSVAAPGKSYLLGRGAAWLVFDAVSNSADTNWRLVVPLPGADSVELFYRGQDGQWVTQQAGDRRAISEWTQPGRYPVFSLSQRTGEQVRYFVKIEHVQAPYSTLPQIMSDAQLFTTMLSEHILLGAYFGLALLVVVLALANTFTYRDAGFGTYSLYIALFILAQGVLTGVAGLYWWPELPVLNSSVPLAISLATAAATWFVRTMVVPKRAFRSLDIAMLILIVLTPLAGLFSMLLQDQLTYSVFNLMLLINMTLLLVVVLVAVLTGGKHSRWIAYGFAPVLLAALAPVLRNYRVIESSFWTEYALLIGSAIEIPLLFYGLYLRMAQERGINLRTKELRYVDPLTGIYTAQVISKKLKQLLDPDTRFPRPYVLLAVDLTNCAELEKKYNRETADRALVMAAARIRSVTRSADTVARIGDAQFALLIVDPVSLAEANDLATKILAAGLRATNELPESEPLRFNIALGHGHDISVTSSADAVLQQLLAALKEMNNGSRKAIRTVAF